MVIQKNESYFKKQHFAKASDINAPLCLLGLNGKLKSLPTEEHK